MSSQLTWRGCGHCRPRGTACPPSSPWPVPPLHLYNLLSRPQLDVFDAAERYQQAGLPLIVLAGKEYGSGSSRDWAAKGPFLLVSVPQGCPSRSCPSRPEGRLGKGPGISSVADLCKVSWKSKLRKACGDGSPPASLRSGKEHLNQVGLVPSDQAYPGNHGWGVAEQLVGSVCDVSEMIPKRVCAWLFNGENFPSFSKRPQSWRSQNGFKAFVPGERRISPAAAWAPPARFQGSGESEEPRLESFTDLSLSVEICFHTQDRRTRCV